MDSGNEIEFRKAGFQILGLAKVRDYRSLVLRMHAFLIMKPITILGIVLVIFGVFVLAFQGITYTKTEKVIDIGPIEATAEREKTIPIHPLAGGAALAAGIILVIAGAKRR